MKSAFILLACALMLPLTGCTSIQLAPQGNFVRLMNDAPESCVFLGAVSGRQGNVLTGPVTPQVNLTLGARNDLINDAVALGADTVVLKDPSKQSALSVDYAGRAYRCLADQVAIR